MIELLNGCGTVISRVDLPASELELADFVIDMPDGEEEGPPTVLHSIYYLRIDGVILSLAEPLAARRGEHASFSQPKKISRSRIPSISQGARS